MFYSIFATSLCVAISTAIQTPASEDFYNAAVVEYHPVKGNGSEDTLLKNTEQFVKIIVEAAKTADIVVFPEASLLHGDKSLFVKVPYSNESKAPADDETLHPALRELSWAARNNSIYVVINIHEKYESHNNTLLYNTNVVFDRNGSIIARYRKYNLFSEVRYLNITTTPERIFFDTDFGVRFGTFTCFDILFKDPTLMLKDYNVTDYVFTTWWFSELPHLTAIQEQAGWSYVTDSNLLASGGNDMRVGSSGSGIYAGKKGPIVYLQTNKDGVALLTAKIYKKGRNGTSSGSIKFITEIIRDVGTQETNTTLKMKTEPSLRDYNTFHLTPDFNNIKKDDYFIKSNFSKNIIIEKELCQGSFCCYFSINMTIFYKNNTGKLAEELRKPDRFHNYEYKLATFNGVRSFDGFANGGIQVCSIIPCLNKNQSSCGKTTIDVPLTQMTSTNTTENSHFLTVFNKIIIKTTTLDKSAFAVPSILESSINADLFGSLINITQFKFDHKESTAELRLFSQKLGPAGIFARVFSRDHDQAGVYSSSAFPIFSRFLLIIPFLLFMF